MKRLSLLLALAACSKGSANPAPAPEPTPPSSVAAPAPSPAPAPEEHLPAASDASRPEGATTRLVDPGQSPRRKLRYAWHVDRKELLKLDLRTGVTTNLPGGQATDMTLPAVHVLVDIDPERIAPDGALAYAWTVRSAAVSDDGRSPPEIAQGLRAEVAAIAHLAGHGAVDARGLSQDITVNPGSLVDAGTTGQMVEQVRQTLRDVAVPFPEEDIGLGARWERIMSVDARGTTATQTDTYTLTALTAATGSVDNALAQTTRSMHATGDAKIRFDLGRLVPQSHFDGATSMTVSGGSAQHLEVLMRLGVDIAGSMR